MELWQRQRYEAMRYHYAAMAAQAAQAHYTQYGAAPAWWPGYTPPPGWASLGGGATGGADGSCDEHISVDGFPEGTTFDQLLNTSDDEELPAAVGAL
jgi:hypothetical protein